MLISEFLKCMLAIIQKHLSAVIIASVIIIASIIFAYFNPYQSCKRDIKKAYPDINKQVLSMMAVDQCGGK